MTGLAEALGSVVGASHVRGDGETPKFAVDGVVPSVVVLPGTVEEVSAVLRICSEHDAAVVPWGGGSSMGLGGIPKRLNVVLGLCRLNRILDHEPGDMTSTVQAGVVLSEYQGRLGSHGQFLALDPPDETRATIGGILAANMSGPRRLRYGSARDLLIGVRVVHADGTVTKGGAKVVKNVTGYDMNKLYVGSLGTLGVIVEATFRLYPIPAAERTWLAPFPSAAHARAVAARILDSPLMPSAIELLNPLAAAQVARRCDIPIEPGCLLAVAVASVAEGVEAQLGQVQKLASEAGCGSDRLLSDDEHQRFWAAVINFDGGRDAETALKASVVLDKVPELLAQGERMAESHDLSAAILSEAGTGILRYYLRDRRGGADRFTRLAEVVSLLRRSATEAKGNLVVLHAPPEVKAKIDVWGPVGETLPLMRGLKEQFDPKGVLNPGRFVGGI